MHGFLNFALAALAAIVTAVCGGLLETAIRQHYPGTTIGALAGCGVFALVVAVVSGICAVDGIED